MGHSSFILAPSLLGVARWSGFEQGPSKDGARIAKTLEHLY